MASLNRQQNGTWRIEFSMAKNERCCVRLGNITRAEAIAAQSWIERLISATAMNAAPDAETSRWVSGIADDLHGKLAKAGLVQPRATAMQSPDVDAFIGDYLSQRPDLATGTITAMNQSRIWLARFLGADKHLTDVTTADADAYKAHMVESGLARATIHKRLRYARHYFAVAIRRGFITDNPFKHLGGAVTGDPSRRKFIPAEVVLQVMDTAPDPQWRLLLGLGRFGGLRIPSEALGLTWRDVNFAEKRFIVRSPKTHHHADGGIRVVPMFTELAPLFQAVFDAATPGTEYVITRYRNDNGNLRTQLRRYIEQAGLKPWPKLWQNLRVSRATELADQYPSHVCAAWLGHTEKIADAFYRQVTDEHFRRATDTVETGAVKSAVKSAVVHTRMDVQGHEANSENTENSRVFTSMQMCTQQGLGVEGLGPSTLRV